MGELFLGKKNEQNEGPRWSHMRKRFVVRLIKKITWGCQASGIFLGSVLSEQKLEATDVRELGVS